MLTEHVCSLTCGEYDQVALDLMAKFYTNKWPDGEVIDREVAETVPCERCGATGGRYEAWTNSEGGYGVALAICPACHHTTMF